RSAADEPVSGTTSSAMPIAAASTERRRHREIVDASCAGNAPGFKLSMSWRRYLDRHVGQSIDSISPVRLSVASSFPFVQRRSATRTGLGSPIHGITGQLQT